MIRRVSAIGILQAILAGLALAAVAWLLWPWQQGQAPVAYFIPTATATITRATVQRPPTSTPFVPTATPEPVIHAVQPGDVLGIIAREYGVTEKAIMEANGLKSDLIIDGQKLLIPNPQRTPLVTARPVTPSPTSTPTSAFVYAAPYLLAPADGAEFHGREARIVLQWTSVAILAEGEWYEVRLWPTSQGEDNPVRFHTHASSLTVPRSIYPAGGDGRFNWTVYVVYRARRASVLSPSASTRSFSWR